jgi:TonB family protein
MLFEIRRNWYVAMPEVARIGKRGRVTLQFEVLKAGTVARIWLVAGSQSDPLDRAALAAISASNPFQPLPAEFKGPNIRLQIMFLYNIPLNER